MADFYTHFSCLLDVGSPDNAARALDLYQAFMEDAAREEVPSEGFLLSVQPDLGATKLWIHDDATGDPQQAIDFVLRCAEAFALTGRWGFQWANTCSRPRIDAFGGGRACPRPRKAHHCRLDRHEWLAGADTDARPQEGGGTMSIPDHARANFQTLLRAAEDNNLALMECGDAKTGETRYVICAVGRDGADYVFTPFGHLADGNPYDAYLPPAETLPPQSPA